MATTFMTPGLTNSQNLLMAFTNNSTNMILLPQPASGVNRLPQFAPITPKPLPVVEPMGENGGSLLSPGVNSSPQTCKRKLDFASFCSSALQSRSYGGTGTTRRNARERNRVKVINMTFAKLREHLPQSVRGRKTRKMSKVDTLRAAIEYIKCLRELLDDQDAVNAVFSRTFLAQHGDRQHMSQGPDDAPSEMTSPLGLGDSVSPSLSPQGSMGEAHSPEFISGSELSPQQPSSLHEDDDNDLLDFGGWF